MSRKTAATLFISISVMFIICAVAFSLAISNLFPPDEAPPVTDGSMDGGADSGTPDGGDDDADDSLGDNNGNISDDGSDDDDGSTVPPLTPTPDELFDILAGMVDAERPSDTDPTPLPPADTDDGRVSVTVIADSHSMVLGTNPVRVLPGESASFDLAFEDNYTLDTADGASFSDGSLVVSDVSEDVTVYLTTRVENTFYTFSVENENDPRGSIKCNVGEGQLFEDQMISLSVTPAENSQFLGWSVGGSMTDGGTMVSYGLNYSFRLTSDVTLYPNFLEEGYAIIKYNLNGGTLASDGTTDVIYTQFDTRIKPCANLMANTGEFTRDGYTLLEYTTAADGSGTAVNPGGLVAIPKSGILEVWAQWSRWSDADNFEYKIVDGGAVITAYLADEHELSVPAELGGYPVTTIAAGAFSERSFETLILPTTLRVIEDGGFVFCPNFDTLYIYDTFTGIRNEAFTRCGAFSNLRLNAGRLPAYVVNAESIATRLEQLYIRDPSVPIVMMVGGSSALYGFDSPAMQEALNNEYFVLNCGTNAGGCGMLYIEALSSFMQEGDIVVSVPEYGNVQFGDYTLYWRTFRATESCYNIYRYVDFSQYKNFFTAFTEFNTSSEARANLAGKSYNIKNTSLTYPNCDLNRTRVYQNKTFGKTNVYASVFTSDRVANFNRVISIVESKGVKYYFSCAPVYEVGLDSTEADIQSYYEKACSSLNCPVISHPKNYIFAYDQYFDSQYHLISSAATERSLLLAEDILAQLEKEK
ncbi:MAG: leucine-rich repeat protein [Clostridia bacterium]|nr:leucine-rich repeat protein [Clostridia bacterium]